MFSSNIIINKNKRERKDGDIGSKNANQNDTYQIERVKELGFGSQATVDLYFFPSLQHYFAIKKFNGAGASKSCIKEKAILNHLYENGVSNISQIFNANNPFFDTYINFNSFINERTMLPMKFYHNLSAFEYVHTISSSSSSLSSDSALPKGLPESVVKRIILQILASLERMHSCSVAHLDIKAENVLFDENFNAILVDFGMAIIVKECNRGIDPDHEMNFDSQGQDLGTTSYRPPESFENVSECSAHSIACPQSLSLRLRPCKTDSWATVVLAFALIFGRLPFGEEGLHHNTWYRQNIGSDTFWMHHGFTLEPHDNNSSNSKKNNKKDNNDDNSNIINKNDNNICGVFNMHEMNGIDKSSNDEIGSGSEKVKYDFYDAIQFFNRSFIVNNVERPSVSDLLSDPYLNTDVISREEYEEYMQRLRDSMT